jgi:hypothetical protein
MPELTKEAATKMQKKAYLKGALTQFSLSGKTKEEVKPLLQKLASIFDSAVKRREDLRATIVAK